MPVKGQDNNLNIHELQDYAESDPNAENIAKTKGGTATDLQDMQRMGRVQELRVRCVAPFDETIVMGADILQRNFKFVGIVGFVTILQATWVRWW